MEHTNIKRLMDNMNCFKKHFQLLRVKEYERRLHDEFVTATTAYILAKEVAESGLLAISASTEKGC